MSINSIVENALNDLPQEIGRKCMEENWFLTRVQDEYKSIYTIIDTQKMMTFNEDEFLAHSERLAYVFMTVPKWYEA